MALPAYSPDSNPVEAIWDWARKEVTVNTCFGAAAKVQGKLDAFFAGLTERAAEAQSRCRTALQAQANALLATANELFGEMNHVDSTPAQVWGSASRPSVVGSGSARPPPLAAEPISKSHNPPDDTLWRLRVVTAGSLQGTSES